MTQSLTKFLQNVERIKYATQQGTKTHALLQQVVIDDVVGVSGNPDIVATIQQRQDLLPYFAANARTEVPIAGVINGIFISRRIDRIVIDTSTKTIKFLDYKTDTDKQIFHDKYKNQVMEYAQLLRSAYPDYKIFGFVLWLQDWELEKIISL